MLDIQNQKMTSRNAEILALSLSGLSGKQIADKLNLDPSTVSVHLAKSNAIMERDIPDSPILKARHDLTQILPDMVDVVKETLQNKDKPELRYKASIDGLQGLQVYVKRTHEDKTERKLDLQIKAERIAIDNQLVDVLDLVDTVQADAQQADYEVIADKPTQTDPPPRGSNTDDRQVDDS